MKLRNIVLTAGVAIAAWLALFADKSPQTNIVEAVDKKNKPVTPSVKSSLSSKKREVDAPPLPVLALKPRSSFIGNGPTRQTAFFMQKNWTPQPVPSVNNAVHDTPTLPALPFTFIGKKFESGHWEVYLSQSDQSLIIHEKDTIDGRYRVDKISPPTLSLTYLPLNQTQTMSIGVFD